MLPIEPHLPVILDTLQSNQALVLEAQPGAGKSTSVPLALLKAAWLENAKIILLEPRRVAVKSIAHYLAEQLNEQVGRTVGYRIRNETCVSEQTRLEIVTEGVLTRMLQSDPELKGIDLIIFDEFHERSIHADLAIMLCKEVQLSLRDDLKVLVMSASMDSQFVSCYLDEAPVVSCEGRTFPIDVRYTGRSNAPLANQVYDALNQHLSSVPCGDVLVFLPGQGEIQRAFELLMSSEFSDQFTIMKLFGAQALSEQTQVLQPNVIANRRIILSTNIAETSLTISGVTLVIDSGLEKRMIFDVKSGLSKLVTESISKASATQRAGRAGRTQAGVCVRLWSAQQHDELDEFQKEEICVSDLSPLVMDLGRWGITQYGQADWLTPPPIHHFQAAQLLNQALGLANETNQLTGQAKELELQNLEPRHAAMMLAVRNDQEKHIAQCISALLGERDVLLSPNSAKFTDRLEVVIAKLAKEKVFGVRDSGLAQIIKAIKATNTSRQIAELSFSDPIKRVCSQLLAFAFPDRIAKQSSNDPRRYTLANGRGVRLKEHDPLINHAWLVVIDCDGQQRDGVIYLAEPLDIKALKTRRSKAFRTLQNWRLDEKKEKLIGREETYYGSLLVDSLPLPTPSKDTFQSCLPSLIKAEGLDLLNWDERCESWLSRVDWLSKVDESFIQLSKTKLLAQIDEWLIPYLNDVHSIHGLKQRPLFELLQANLSWEQHHYLDKHAPAQYVMPSGKSTCIEYGEAGPTVSVRLQEVFGEVGSLELAGGKVKLRYELLSPAMRPLQTTSDLANFWQNAYVEVAKEMRGRYPKHRWPDEPWAEKAGHSLKSKQR
ncbi:ATP-dependent helicase HrpB [Pseudoalteromonas luteoviolacea B = ATCC 29581]|nr:ATP-dependent helicase HrpB [Pseudoalteromonas luteoviolacea B = ATCC 29581]